MARGPRYVPRHYQQDRDKPWRVYDTWFQLPTTDRYADFRACRSVAERMNRNLDQEGKKK